MISWSSPVWTAIRSGPEIRDRTVYSLQKNRDRTACGPVFFFETEPYVRLKVGLKHD